MFEDKITTAEYDLYSLRREIRRMTKAVQAEPELFSKRDIKAAMKAMKEFKILGRNLVDG